MMAIKTAIIHDESGFVPLTILGDICDVVKIYVKISLSQLFSGRYFCRWAYKLSTQMQSF